MTPSIDILLITCDQAEQAEATINALAALPGVRLWVWQNGHDKGMLDVLNRARGRIYSLHVNRRIVGERNAAKWFRDANAPVKIRVIMGDLL